LNRGFNSSLNDDTVVTCKVEIAGSSAITLVGRRLGERRREVAQVGKQQSGAGGRRAGSSFRRGWGVGRGPRLGNGAASDGGGEVRGRPATARSRGGSCVQVGRRRVRLCRQGWEILCLFGCQVRKNLGTRSAKGILGCTGDPFLPYPFPCAYLETRRENYRNRRGDRDTSSRLSQSRGQENEDRHRAEGP
jgi:hypothetical protein